MSESQGVLGGRSAPRRRGDRLTERELRECWAIPGAMRRALVERLIEIVRDPGSGPREVTSAAWVILPAGKINQSSISVVIKAGQHEELERRLRAA
jgi:hypothetical protein